MITKKYYSIDRFEEDFAVLEDDDEHRLNVLRSKLPIGVGEGDVLYQLEGIYLFDSEETNRRKEDVLAKLTKFDNENQQ